MMNRGYFKSSFKDKVKSLYLKDDVLSFLKLMRKCQFYSQRNNLWGEAVRKPIGILNR